MNKVIFLLLMIGAASLTGNFVFAGNTSLGDDGSIVVTGPSTGYAGPRAPGSLTTLFAANNGYRGNMFDITPAIDIEITAIDVNVDPVGLSTDVDVWYRSGTCVGNESTTSGWTLLGSGSGVSAGHDLPTNIPLPGNGVLFKAGQTYGLYVDVTNYPSPGINYTNGSNTYSNVDLSLTTHCGKGDPAFTGSTFIPREWNGTIYYETNSGLKVDVTTISEFTGGTATFTLDATPANAGKNYLIFANVTGTVPGFSPPPGLVTIPINWDIFTNLTISLTNTTIFQNFFGTLDANGQAIAAFDTLGPFTGVAGLTINFAFGADISYWDYASNAVSIDIVP